MESNNPVDYETPNSIAAIWSMMLPGLGQLLKGRVMPGIIWAILVGSGYFFFFWPGLILHALCIIDAAVFKGNQSLMDFDTWPKRFALLGIVILLLGYIVIRNYY